MATSYGWFFVTPVQNLPGWGSRLVDIGQHTCPQGPWARPGRGTGVPDLAPPPSAPSSQLSGSAEGLLHSLGNHGRGTSLVSDAEVERDERGNVPQLGFHVALGTNAEKVSQEHKNNVTVLIKSSIKRSIQSVIYKLTKTEQSLYSDRKMTWFLWGDKNRTIIFWGVRPKKQVAKICTIFLFLEFRYVNSTIR